MAFTCLVRAYWANNVGLASLIEIFALVSTLL
jgi:hypothetical protein